MAASIATQAEVLARRLLEQDPGGLRRAKWTAEASAMVMERTPLQVNSDLVLAGAWASVTLGARTWEDRHGQGYQVADVSRDLGVDVARVVGWVVPEPWEEQDEHLRWALLRGPAEAKVVAMAQVLVEVVLAGRDADEALAVRLARAGLEVCPDLTANVAVNVIPEVPLA